MDGEFEFLNFTLALNIKARSASEASSHIIHFICLLLFHLQSSFKYYLILFT